MESFLYSNFCYNLFFILNVNTLLSIKLKKLFSILTFSLCATFSFGQVNWLQSYGGFSNEEILDLEVDSNGDLIHVGYFFGALDPGSGTMNSAGNSDIFIMKTDG